MIAQHILRLAAAILPIHRRDWGFAMRRELDTIESGPEALTFALGCLWAACSERITLMILIVNIGRWGVGLVTVAYGAFFLYGVYNGISMALGHMADPYYEMLIKYHHTEAATEHLHLYPFIGGFNLLMGIGHMAAGGALMFWRPKAFAWACLASTLPAVGLTLFGLINHLPRPESYAWPFGPLALLVAAAAFLWWLEKGEPRNAALA